MYICFQRYVLSSAEETRFCKIKRTTRKRVHNQQGKTVKPPETGVLMFLGKDQSIHYNKF